jgi:hypothetical protein
LVRTTRRRYQATIDRDEKRRMLAEFVATTGYHPKSALRVLNQQTVADDVRHRNRPLLYDEAARQSLIILKDQTEPPT